MDKSHLTAITRTKPSAPMVRLASDDRLIGNVLDYGCGKGFDANYYNTQYYDPYYQPIMPVGKFKTIVSNYVLNVIESPHIRLLILEDIQYKLKCSGVAYITVRNDRRALNGTTYKGTWQGFIVLRLPVVYRCSGFITYELRVNDNLDPSIQSVF